MSTFRFFILGILFLSFGSLAGLSATTVQTIQGNAPRFSPEAEDQIRRGEFGLLAFSYGRMSYNESNIADFSLLAPGAVSPAKIKAPITLPITEAGDIIDPDLDSDFYIWYPDVNTPTIKITDANGVDVTNRTENLCQVAKSNPGPYTLEIWGNVRLSSQYGDPRSRNYTDSEGVAVTPRMKYTFSPKGVCFIQPNLKGGDGRNTEQWNTTDGFYPSEYSNALNFPSTGFNNASFNLKIIGIDAMTANWQVISQDVDSKVTVNVVATDSETVKVTLNGPTKSSPLTKFSWNNVFTIHDDTDSIQYIMSIDKWYVPYTGQANYASSSCGRYYQLPSRQDFSNSDVANAVLYPPYPTTNGTNSTVGNYDYTRVLYSNGFFEGSLLSEWGEVSSTSYVGSDWEPAGSFFGGYWLREKWSVDEPYVVYPASGLLTHLDVENSLQHKVCVSKR